jgi:protein-tyrosine phosphatase
VRWLESSPSARALWRPVPDLHMPASDQADVLLAELRQRLEMGDRLLIHCGAGLGRAGTVAAALLITMGSSVTDALAVVASSRPAAGPQTAEQRDFLLELAARCGRAPAS